MMQLQDININFRNLQRSYKSRKKLVLFDAHASALNRWIIYFWEWHGQWTCRPCFSQFFFYVNVGLAAVLVRYTHSGFLTHHVIYTMGQQEMLKALILESPQSNSQSHIASMCHGIVSTSGNISTLSDLFGRGLRKSADEQRNRETVSSVYTVGRLWFSHSSATFPLSIICPF